jgi:ubiquitin-like domain-containing CTD phosphatase 1
MIYLHFLDLVVWSQTSWRWLEVKLTELNLLTNPKFQFAFVLDKEAMFKVKTYQKQKKEVVEHYVKPLQIIWSLLGPQWNEKNTVHVDDLGRNFVMNPRNGILVKAFYIKEGVASNSDRELFDLAKYLLKIASQADIGSSEHAVR